MDGPIVLPACSRVLPKTSLGLLGIVLSIVFVGGCGGDSVPTAAPLHPVKGKVKLETSGTLAGMKILFIPNGGGARTASGNLQTDGSFELTTSSAGDGIAEGNYKVRLDKINPVVDKKSKPAPTVPVKYLDEDESGLTATIKSDTTEVGPFILTTQKAAASSKRGRDNND